MKLNRGEPDHPHWKKPFTPGEMAVTWSVFGACSVVLGLREWFDPSQAPFSGRWSWLNTMAVNALGQRGPAYLYMGLGAILVFAGCVKWREHRSAKAIVKK